MRPLATAMRPICEHMRSKYLVPLLRTELVVRDWSNAIVLSSDLRFVRTENYLCFTQPLVALRKAE
jgi:hypothetical protein